MNKVFIGATQTFPNTEVTFPETFLKLIELNIRLLGPMSSYNLFDSSLLEFKNFLCDRLVEDLCALKLWILGETFEQSCES